MWTYEFALEYPRGFSKSDQYQRSKILANTSVQEFCRCERSKILLMQNVPQRGSMRKHSQFTQLQVDAVDDRIREDDNTAFSPQ